ncbi:MAG: alpha/beta hydrolase [Myxococcota bacterium]|nr:alpha/beta hydrolase [Myxococcota bacterium]MDW8361872.1 alpha/beta hydrolase [Myxococcales bacterium]
MNPPPHPTSPAPGRRRRRRVIVVLAVLLSLVATGWIASVLSVQRRFVFPRWATRPEPHAGEGIADLERLWLDLEQGGRVEAWLLRAPGAHAEDPRPAVIFAHGNAELIEHWPETLEPYRSELGMHVLLPEYRGYGRSAGTPSEQGIVDDFERWVQHLAQRPDVDASRLVYHGRSLGGGVVTSLATRRPPRALVLQSTFTSVSDMARRWWLPRALVLDPFDNERGLATLDAPVLVMHGRRDTLVPPSHAERLVRAARRARLVWYDAGHNDCPPDWTPWFAEIRSFLAQAGVLTVSSTRRDVEP